jgi:hypothetical protein
MSLRYEQEASLLMTRELLLDLLNTSTRPKTVKELKERARRCLRHFPPLDKDGKPIFSTDSFSLDNKLDTMSK